MENSKQFNKLPVAGKTILTDYKKHKNTHTLFNDILKNLDTQNSVASKQVRRSMFRGLLRNHFGLTDAQMRLIETTDDQKKEYHAVLQEGYGKQHEDRVSKKLMMEIMGVSNVCYLMVRSGLRVGELLGNPMKLIRGSGVYFKLNKKEKSKYYKIHIIGDSADWVKRFRAMRRSYKDQAEAIIVDRINKKLKMIIPEGFYKKSTHICRAIYVQYINKFKNDKSTLPQLITKYLNHDNPTASVYYQHIRLEDDIDDFINPEAVEDVEAVES